MAASVETRGQATPQAQIEFMPSPTYSPRFRDRGHEASTSSSRRKDSPTRGPGSPPRTASPTRGKGSATQESITSSRLFRDISPTRVFTQAPQDSTRASLPELFKQKKGLQSLRPTYAFNPDTSQLGDDARQPKLLQRLEALLEEKLALVDKVGAASKGFAATQMRTDAYRQVFDAFLHSFTTYRSLLMRVKHEYDTALDDALASVYDNVHMRAELAVAEERLDSAVHRAEQLALQDAAASRKEIQDEIDQHEALAAEAERRCQAADAEMQALKANIAKLRAQEQELTRQNRQAKFQLLSTSSFAKGQAGKALLARYQTEEPAAGAPQGSGS